MTSSLFIPKFLSEYFRSNLPPSISGGEEGRKRSLSFDNAAVRLLHDCFIRIHYITLTNIQNYGKTNYSIIREKDLVLIFMMKYNSFNFATYTQMYLTNYALYKTRKVIIYFSVITCGVLHIGQKI